MKMLDKLNDDKYGKAKKIVMVLLLLVFAFGFSLLLPFVRNIIIDTIQKLIHRQLENPGLWHGRMILSGFITLFYDIIAIVLCYNFSKKTLSFQNVFIACIFSAFVFTNLIFIFNNCFKLDWMIIFDFSDILVIKGYANSDLYSSNYPPLAVVLYKFFNYFLPPNIDFNDLHFISLENNIELYLTSVSALNHILMMFIFSSTFILFFSLFKSFDGKETKRYLLASVFFLTGPFIYALQRGNIVIYAIAFTLIFVKYRNDERKWVKELALISLAIAANIKLYPAIFGILLIKEKDFKSALRCALYGILLFVFPAVIVGQNPISCLFTYLTSISNWSNEVKISLENVSSAAENIIIEDNVVSQTAKFTMPYLSKGIFILIIGLTFTFLAQNEYQMLLFLSSMCLLIPTPSYYYNLVFLFLPLVSLLNKGKTTIPEKISGVLLIFSMIYDVGKFGCHPRTRWHFYTLVIVNIIFVITGLFSGRMKSKKHKIS